MEFCGHLHGSAVVTEEIQASTVTVLAETDHLNVLGRSVGSNASGYIDCLDDIGLTLGIVTVEYVNRRPDIKIEPSVISEIIKVYTLNYHLSSDREDKIDVILAFKRLDDAGTLSAVDFNPDGLVIDVLENVQDIS